MRIVFSLLLSIAATMAQAHGLLLSLENQGARIVGNAYFTNGERAATQPVEVLDLDAPSSTPVALTTDAQGSFGFDARSGHRYRVSVFGEEGHDVQMELTAGSDERAALIDEKPAEDTSWLPPAWAVIGGGLLLSLVPVALNRFRRRG